MANPTLDRRGLLAGGIAAAATVAWSGCTRAPTTNEWSKQKRYASVDGVRMAYYEVGEGDPIVFLHGNPTSSYLWRKVIPFVQDLGRCIAPDMVGMGDSQKLPDSGPGVYTYLTQRKYLFGLLEQLGVTDNVIFVIHDWGSAMGFNWAWQNPDRVKGIAYMEALLRPPERAEDPQPSPFFQVLRSPRGEEAILQDNLFIKGFFQEVGLYLTEEDKAEYMRPFLEPGESRRPMLTWPREIPFGGEPAANEEVMRGYSNWLAESAVPKLFLQAQPGLIFSVEELRDFARSLPNQKIVRVYGSHFIQEVSGEAIGRALRDWIQTLND
jgi:haloalkane dehalogenase